MNEAWFCVAHHANAGAHALCSPTLCCFELWKAKMLARLSDMHPLSDLAAASVFCGMRCPRLMAAGGGLQILGNTTRAAPGPSASTSPDEQLIAACHTYDALERCIDAFNDPGDPAYIEDDHARDRATAPIEAEQVPLMERICTLRAVTPEGSRARARSFLLRHKAIDPAVDAVSPHRSWDDRLVAAVLRDLSEEP